MKTALGAIRRVLVVALVILVAAVLALAIAPNAGPALGHRLLVIRGGSMEPAIPLGSVVDIVPTSVEQLHAGDVVTITEPNGVVVTHRVTRVAQLPDGCYVEIKGDANSEPDPVLTPAASVMGRVDFAVPALGYFVYLLTIPAGILSLFCLAATMLLAIWLIEDLEEDERQQYGGGEAGEGGVGRGQV